MNYLGLYFSGTGNSRLCVEEFMKTINKDYCLSSIEDYDVIQKIEAADEIILAYPIYYSNIPLILKEFINIHNHLWNKKKIFLIATQGMFSGDGSGYCARLLKKYGAIICGGVHIKMPDNTIDVKLLKNKKERETIARGKEKVHHAATLYSMKTPPKQGLHPTSRILGLFVQRLWFSRMVKTYKNFPKINHNTCIGCKNCVVSCPMTNLSLDVNTRTIHKNKCTLCYRCVHVCPTHAITILGKKVTQTQSSLIK